MRVSRTIALVVFALLIASRSACPESRSWASSHVSLSVQPEQEMTVSGQAINLKIRLAPGVSASLWSADTCLQPPADAYTIKQSGRFQISLPEVSPTDAQLICLRSSDGQLSSSVRIGVAGSSRSTSEKR